METINKIRVCSDKNIKQIQEDGKTYYVCSVCGRMSFRKVVSYGKIYCNKHYNQLKEGMIKDENPRSRTDKNEIRIDGDVAYIDLYDMNETVIATALIDAEDVPKVRYSKWRLTRYGYVVSQRKDNKCNYLHRIVLSVDDFVDHINHNTLDNRKSNLRVVTKSQNQMNSNYKGVTKTSAGKYYAHIKLHGKMLNLGVYIDEAEALFARWYAETLVFKEYQYYKKEKPVILKSRESEIKTYVEQKVQRL